MSKRDVKTLVLVSTVNSVLGTVKIGQHYVFRYYFDYPGTTMPELRDRIGQRCLVLSIEDKGNVEDGEDSIFRVRFEDGYESSAFEGELEDSDKLMSLPTCEEESVDINSMTVGELRDKGFVVVMFRPSELKDADPRLVSDRLVELGNEVISDLQGF